MSDVQEISIEEMAEDIEDLVWCQGVELFKVTENFLKNGKRTYVVRGLHMETEEDVVCCSDVDDLIFENRYILMMFLKDSVKSIKRVVIDNEPHGELLFDDGNVLIEILH